MTQLQDDKKINQEAYLRLRDELKRDYTGQFAAIVRGKLTANAPTFDALLAKLDVIEPEASRRLVFLVGDTYPEKNNNSLRCQFR